MKQLLGMMTLLAATASQANAQNFSLGPIVGINHSWQNNVDGRQFKPGVNAGVTAIYSIHPHWGIGSDIRFSMEGVKAETSDNQSVTTYNANLNYIRIPLKGIYFFGKPGTDFRPKIYAGPSLGFLVGGKTSVEVSNKNSGNVQTISESPSRDVFKKFDIGVTAGTGFNYRLHKRGVWLNCDIAYTHGLPDIHPSNVVERSNRNLTASVGVAFPIGTF